VAGKKGVIKMVINRLSGALSSSRPVFGGEVLTWDDGLREVPALPAKATPGRWIVRRRVADQALLEWVPAWLELEIWIVRARGAA